MVELTKIHPAVSGAAISFVVLLVILDLSSWLRKRMLYSDGGPLVWAIGLSLATIFFSGYLTEGFLAPPDDPLVRDAIARHHVVGRTAVILFPIMAVMRRLASSRRSIVWGVGYSVAVLVLTGALVCGGAMGGTLVFEHGVGVTTLPR